MTAAALKTESKSATDILVENLVAAGISLVAGYGFALVHLSMPLLIGWIPAGVVISLVLVVGPHVLPGVAIGSAVAMLPFSSDPGSAIISALGLSLTSLMVWWALTRQLGSEFKALTVDSMGHTLVLSGGAYVLMALVLGEFSTQSLMSHGGLGESHGMGGGGHGHHNDMLERMLSDAIGAVVVLPLALYLQCWRKNAPASGERHSRAWLAFAVLLATTLAIYSGYIENTWGIVHTTLLILPPAVWLALEYDIAYTLAGNILVGLIVGVGTSLGHGPFKDHISGLPLLTMVYSLTTLLVAAGRAERLAATAQILLLATRDSLTGLFNRGNFLDRLDQALAAAKRYQRKLALMFIDLDNFKEVNDTLGHRAGDALLVLAAERIRACLRKESTLARFGGDEMIVMIEHAENDESLRIVADRIVGAMANPFEIEERECRISCSMGVSRFPDDGETVSDLVMKADIAMYEVKASGRNGWKFFAATMPGADAADRRSLRVGGLAVAPSGERSTIDAGN